jgi:predicted outer membrane lipoprotein
MMKNKFFSWTIALGLGFGLACTFGLITPELAQSQNTDDEDVYQDNEKDTMSGSLGGINPIDLIHDANLSTGRNAEEFNTDSQIQIEDSAAEFRRLQQERMQQQYNTGPEPTEETAK